MLNFIEIKNLYKIFGNNEVEALTLVKKGMTKDELFEVLDNGFSESVIEIQDLAGDNDHYAVKIISNKFKGLSKISQHKLVYDVLGKKMGYTLHALSIKTEVPKE